MFCAIKYPAKIEPINPKIFLNKGKISLESKKGSGTKFYINIKTLTNENK